MKQVFAIRHKPSGFYLPEPEGYGGRGGSFVKPVDCSGDGPNPRIFKHMRSAKAALNQWLRGEHHGITEGDWNEWTGEYYSYTVGADIVPQLDRIRTDMEIVAFNLMEIKNV